MGAKVTCFSRHQHLHDRFWSFLWLYLVNRYQRAHQTLSIDSWDQLDVKGVLEEEEMYRTAVTRYFWVVGTKLSQLKSYGPAIESFDVVNARARNFPRTWSQIDREL